MELQRTRLFLFVSLFVVGIALYSAWQQEHPVTPAPLASTSVPSETKSSDIPAVTAVETQKTTTEQSPTTKTADLIEISTDVLNVQVDAQGGDIIRAELLKFSQTLNSPQGVVLLDRSKTHYYIAQTGLIGNEGPDSREKGRAHYVVEQKQYQLEPNQDVLKVNMHWHNNEGIKVTKTLTFTRGSYLVNVSYTIDNSSTSPWLGNFYGQIPRKYVKEKTNSMFGVQMYEGGAMYTPKRRFKKVSFPDMKKSPLKAEIEGGWAAQLEHYFLTAWIPEPNTINTYYTRVDEENIFNIGAISSIEVSPQTSQTVTGSFYIGPEIADTLKAISPGLNLTIDYGILWPISQLLFWLLKTINAFLGNWGWSIVFVTLIIKILFYKLSASSYRSMGKMRLLQPKVELLKERHKDDKQQFSAALMELYRKEKMNPLGGCLPILIQIPVFIALYYVLLESVELRHAPFMFWIKDLSSRDPYFVLPLIMGATMFLQQKMNPPPPDPIQAKVMMFMPVIFTVLFVSFPAGLVLYWTVNNILSIAQQWFITRNLAVNVPKKAK